MATLVLGAAGAALGGSLSGSFLGMSGAVIGRAAGSALGRFIDQSVLGTGGDAVETGKIDRLRVSGASEGTAIPRIIGRTRVAGHVIWASQFKERRDTVAGGGKGSPKAPSQTRLSYSVSIAIAICEGEIQRIGRIWADGQEVSRSRLQFRVYRGTEDQAPDALIEAIEGIHQAPAFRGTAYVIFEDLDVTSFGNRIPQMSFEVVRHAEVPGFIPGPSKLIEGVALVPGTGEYALATTAVHYNYNAYRESANINTEQGVSDFSVSIDDLSEELPHLNAVSLVVSWFGDDLRCGHCTIQPCVENSKVEGTGQRWTVAGITRGTAKQVPLVEGKAIYGGTPSDQSVVEAIRDLNSRGINVTFYPFILMDQLPGNGLTDPYGGAEQASLPWRGRITTDLVAGIQGSTDRTDLARSQVQRFYEGAGSSAFGSYKSFILHYAQICASAGGVEAFCLGSEMKGLTRIRDQHDNFPFVEALIDLAGLVRKILPNTKISYAADWSEYFGYHPFDTDNVHFNLDPLWAAPEIDFIGIDNYMPISDWRDDPDHKDKKFGSIHNLEYLNENIEGGEGYDWFYSSHSGREAQDRIPITDGLHGEPWIFRYKDIRGWWENYHHERIDGVRLENPTGWVPKSKPFRFTEYGCPAVDKGANQPNKFLDFKSSESDLPYFSNARQDDAMQMQYLRGVLSYWKKESNNPLSDSFQGRMLDLSSSLAWAWDTRPWPFFPEMKDLWSDSESHARGHWITGRTGNQALATVIADICSSVGINRVDVSRVRGVVRGYEISTNQTARADLQPLLIAYGVEASEQNGRLVFSMRADAPEIFINYERLVRKDQSVILKQRGSDAEAPARVLLTHIDPAGNFELRTSDATLPSIKPYPVFESELPLCLLRSEAQELAERFLTQASVGRDTVKLELPPSMRSLKPGNLFRIDQSGDLWRVDRIEDRGTLKVEAVRTEKAQYEERNQAVDPTHRRRPVAPLPIDVSYLELPLLTGKEVAHAPYVAVSGNPWPGLVALYSSTDDSNYRQEMMIGDPAIVGVTESVMERSRPSVLDNGAQLVVRMPSGSLESVSDLSFLSGGNSAAIGNGSPQGWEVFQFKKVELLAPGLWGLSGRLRGQRGTEWAIADPWPEGSKVVFLNDGLQQVDSSPESIGVEKHFRAGPAQLSLENSAFDYQTVVTRGEGLRPYAPVHLRGERLFDGTRFNWVRRTRTGGGGWEEVDVPLGERTESYQIRVLDQEGNIKFESRAYQTSFFLQDHLIDSHKSASMKFEVSQISEEVGTGAASSIMFFMGTV